MGKKDISYKEAIAEIEGILRSIENGEPDIDDLSKKLKRANELIKFCKEKLHKTEKDIDKLVEDIDG